MNKTNVSYLVKLINDRSDRYMRLELDGEIDEDGTGHFAIGVARAHRFASVEEARRSLRATRAECGADLASRMRIVRRRFRFEHGPATVRSPRTLEMIVVS